MVRCGVDDRWPPNVLTIARARSSYELPFGHHRSFGVGEGASQSRVIAWLAEVGEDRVFMSVVTLAELRYGIERIVAQQAAKALGKTESPVCL
jgi:hypothetical protein